MSLFGTFLEGKAEVAIFFVFFSSKAAAAGQLVVGERKKKNIIKTRQLRLVPETIRTFPCADCQAHGHEERWEYAPKRSSTEGVGDGGGGRKKKVLSSFISFFSSQTKKGKRKGKNLFKCSFRTSSVRDRDGMFTMLTCVRCGGEDGGGGRRGEKGSHGRWLVLLLLLLLLLSLLLLLFLEEEEEL